MNLPSLILDTCVFRDEKAMNWLSKYNGDLKIPPIVYMERYRQIMGKEDLINKFEYILKKLEIEVMMFDKNVAGFAAELMAGRNAVCEKCGKIDWADTIVASYIFAGDYIISNNKKDFPTFGMFENRILTVNEMMQKNRW
jgi:hypothetical protein